MRGHCFRTVAVLLILLSQVGTVLALPLAEFCRCGTSLECGQCKVNSCCGESETSATACADCADGAFCRDDACCEKDDISCCENECQCLDLPPIHVNRTLIESVSLKQSKLQLTFVADATSTYESFVLCEFERSQFAVPSIVPPPVGERLSRLCVWLN